MNTTTVILLFLFGIIIGFFLAQNYLKKENNFVILNSDIIEGLHRTDLNLSSAKEVFSFVFMSLDNEVTIYPGENYFYFKFPMKGKMISGALSLFADNRDEGIIGLGYHEEREDPSDLDGLYSAHWSDDSWSGGGGQFGKKDGVFVQKIDDFAYKVTFEGKTVKFKLYDIGLHPPKKLLDNEVFVGPVVDEAGIKFHLIFNTEVSRLYMLLDENGFVADVLEKYNDKRNLVVGRRTKFVFYDDKENDRRLFVGVKGENTLQNNWYDGPHDQMPDNYIYAGRIPEYQTYLEANYPGLSGKIDKYGNYIHENGTRVAVAPYGVYFSEDYFSFVDACQRKYSGAKFYDCITQQNYDIPSEVNDRLDKS